MIQKSISLVQQYVDRNRKSVEYGNIMATFPSVNFHIGGKFDFQAVNELTPSHLNGITLPISNGNKIMGFIENLSDEDRERFRNSNMIITDFETEFWYYESKKGLRRRQQFTQMEDMPKICEDLFRIKSRGEKKKSIHNIKRDYNSKLNRVFGGKDDRNIVRMVISSMRHASKNLLSSLPLPPAPMIIDNGVSLDYCIKVNDIYNKFRDTFDLFKTVYYPIHPNALDNPAVARTIIKHVYDTNPDFVIIGTISGENYLFPTRKNTTRKTEFDHIARELAHYAKTNNCVVGWYDKGEYCSSYGLKLIKEGFDFIISPLKGHYNEGGRGNGPAFGYILNEYSYFSWTKYLEDHSDHYINDLPPEELNKMSPHKQWKYKRRIELKTRESQFNQIYEKLEDDGSLDGYEVRLKVNKID